MSWMNLHTHSRFCDGKGEPADYAREALRRGMSGLGFSSHAPVPFPTDWTMPPDLLPAYCETIRRLQQELAPRIPVFLGLEIDFIPGAMGPRAPSFQNLGLDYTIGSVHFIGRDARGVPWAIDAGAAEFDACLRDIHKGDIRKVVERYYELLREMVRTHCPDVLAHLDLIKKNNLRGRYFSEGEDWYRAAVFETLEVVAESEAIVEANTGGIARKRIDALYPSSWILARCLEMGIPITLTSDCHQPDQLTACFESAAAELIKIGFAELRVLEKEGWRSRPFSEKGIGKRLAK